MTALKIFIEKVWIHLFPEKCPGCRKKTRGVCPECLSHARDVFERGNVLAVFSYRHPHIKNLLWKLKFRNARWVASVVAVYLYDEILGQFADEIHTTSEYKNSAIFLIPIPLTKKRKQDRGYNQSEILALEIQKICGSNLFSVQSSLLLKTKETKPQVETKSRKERLANVRGCFSLENSEEVVGRTVVLIDDITTTGATFREADKVLQEAGVGRVISLAVAH